jgi:hypothetical protein
VFFSVPIFSWNLFVGSAFIVAGAVLSERSLVPNQGFSSTSSSRSAEAVSFFYLFFSVVAAAELPIDAVDAPLVGTDIAASDAAVDISEDCFLDITKSADLPESSPSDETEQCSLETANSG